MHNPKQISVVIPAAGVGRRMRSYGPKSLIEIGNRETVIGRQLSLVRSVMPHAEVIVVAGFDAERLIRGLPPDVKVVENEFYEDTNVARSIGMGLRVVSHPNVLVMYGDLVFSGSAIGWVANAKSSSLLVDSRSRMGPDEIGVMIVDGRVTNFNYGLRTKWAQIAYITDRELELFKRLSLHPDRKKHFTFEILNLVIDAGGRFRAVEPKGYRMVEIDSSKEIDLAERIDDEDFVRIR